MKNELILKIEERYADMRTSEQKVADYIMDHMDEIPKMSLGKIASECNVSEPTVLRMVKAIGYQGLREFRTAVISAIAVTKGEHQNPVLYGYSLNKDDKVQDIPRKVVTTTAKILEDNLKNISVKTYENVIKAIKNAQIIDIYSVENSNVIAKDLLTKLLYLGFQCRHMDDTYHQRIAASNLTSQDQLFYGDAIFSRASQIVLVDMIYMGLIVSDYEKYAKCLDQSAGVIKDKAYKE